MAKGKKARLSTKSLASLDPVGSYGKELVAIQGLVSPSSQAAWKGDDYDKHCFTLAAWRKIGEPLVTRELYVQRPIRQGQRWPGVFEQHTVHRMEVLLSKDQTRAIFTRRLTMTKPDKELLDLSVELLRPVILTTQKLGDFTLDRGLSRFNGRARWKGKDIDVHLPGPTAAVVVGGAELAEVERALQTAQKVWKAQKTWDRKCKQRAVKDLLTIKNKHWLEEGESPLFAIEFASRMRLTSVSVEADGYIEFWYEDVGEMFTDHAILVRATLRDGPMRAGIEG